MKRSHKITFFTLNQSSPLDRVINSITCLPNYTAIHSTFFLFHEDIRRHLQMCYINIGKEHLNAFS